MSSRKLKQRQVTNHPPHLIHQPAPSIAIPTTSKGKKNHKAPDYYGFENSVCFVSDPETMTAPKRPKPKNPVI